jgi:hypothetical protein
MGCAYKDPGYPVIFSRNRGGIAIFLSVVIFALSFMIFFSASRLTAGKNMEGRYMTVDIALRSLLADYDDDIYEEYGLTVIGYSDADVMEREFKRILIKNDFKETEDAYIVFTESVEDKGILKELICEHMENRVISKIANEILSKFSILSSLSKFREMLELKSVIESVIFDCEKICAAVVTDFADINKFDIEKALAGDTDYLIYKLGELRKFADVMNDLLDSLERLASEKDGIAGDNDFFGEMLSRIEVFSSSIPTVREVIGKADQNISLLITLLELLDTDESISDLLSGYLDIDMDLGSLIPKLAIEESLRSLDLRSVKGGFFDELLLKVTRDDIVLGDSIAGLLPYIAEGESILSGLGSFMDLFTDFSFNKLFDSVYDQIIINEYIIDKFSYETKNISGRYFTDEIEYIIFGKASQNDDLRKIKLALLLLRTALNYVGIHLDREKTALARSVGTAVSLLTFGIGGGVAAELIISSWALYEAYNDLSLLLSGEDIAVIKGKGDYSIDFGTGAGVKSPVTAGYEDYLRLFLILSDEDAKLGRIRNLICLNTGTDTGLLYTALKGGFRDAFSIEKGY